MDTDGDRNPCMRVEVNLTQEDWDAYVRFMQRGRKPAYFSYFLPAIAWSGLLGALLFATSDAAGGRWISAALVSILVAGAACVLFLRRQFRSMPNWWAGRAAFEIVPEGLKVSTARLTTQHAWGLFRGIEQTSDHLFLCIDSVTALVLPKRDLRDRAQEFAAELKHAIDAARSTYGTGPVGQVQSAALPDDGAWGAVVRNILGGFRLLTFLPVTGRTFVASWRQTALFIVFSVLLWIGLSRWGLAGEAFISWIGLGQLAWLAAIFVVSTLLIVSGGPSGDAQARLFTALAFCLPGYAVLVFVTGLAGGEAAPRAWATPLLLGIASICLYRAARVVALQTVPSAVAIALVPLALTAWAYAATVYVPPEVWYAEGDADDVVGLSELEAEELMFRQPALIDLALERLAPGRQGTTDVYFAGFAGDGSQGVFAKEVRFARNALSRKYDLTNKAIELINTAALQADIPLATHAGLRRVLAGIGDRMNVDEDVLILFLTSHGSADGYLQVHQHGLSLTGLSAEDLAQAVRASGIRWRAVIVSACYSGMFMEPLRDEHALIITASRADRASFGCSDDRELTYFGEAFFRDALPASASLEEAARKAAELVTTRERASDYTPSEPQIFVGGKMRGKLAELAFHPVR